MVSQKKKKKKKVFTKIETDFSAGFVTFRSVGGDASRNGAELFKIRADFSAKIVTFRLVGGGCIPPIPPPKSATTRYTYFSGIYKEIFLRCDVTGLLSVVVMLLAYKTFNLASVLTKIKFFVFTKT